MIMSGNLQTMIMSRLNDELDLGVEQLQSAPTLWELANAVGRPVNRDNLNNKEGQTESTPDKYYFTWTTKGVRC